MITKIEYHFDDSSVPPEYHRSYIIILTAEALNITVDSYGDILAEEKISLLKGQFQSLIDSLSRLEIKTGKDRESLGCTGGTGEKLVCFSGTETILSGYVSHCGGKDFGTLHGNVSALAEQIRTLIPDFKELIK